MRTKFYLPFIALALMATSCNSKKEAEQEAAKDVLKKASFVEVLTN